jgi:superfamily II DNA or RNA helicase
MGGGCMNTTIANRIYIEEPTLEIIRWAKDNLRFPNPEYEKKQRMGFWVGRTPKNIELFERDGNKLILPFGVCRQLMPMLRGTPVFTDFRQNNHVPYGGENVPLYDYQKEAVVKMIEAKYGILKAATGSGKTQMGIALIKAFRHRALWLCHTADLLKQSMDRAAQYIDTSTFGTITEGKVNVGIGLTFATVQTMSRIDLTQYRDYWDVVIVDECHRVSSSATTFTQYEKVLNHLAARHKIGLSATVARADGLIKATFALLGEVAYEVPEAAIADRIMGVKVSTVETATELTDDCLNDDGTINYVKLIEHLTTDPERNKLIARCIMKEKDHSCIILSDRLEQLKTIIGLLPDDMQAESVYIDGKMQSKKAKAEREQALDDIRSGKKKYLFASVSLCKEGLDAPRLDRLFLCSPVKFSAVVIQAVGRVRRTFAGKETPVVIDFVDKNIGYCERAYKERCRSYRKLGAVIEKGDVG